MIRPCRVFPTIVMNTGQTIWLVLDACNQVLAQCPCAAHAERIAASLASEAAWNGDVTAAFLFVASSLVHCNQVVWLILDGHGHGYAVCHCPDHARRITAVLNASYRTEGG